MLLRSGKPIVLAVNKVDQGMSPDIYEFYNLGLGDPIATMGPSGWSNDLAPPEQYPTVVRRLQVIYAGGALAFSSLPGILADHLGGYLPAYLLFTTINVLSLVCIALSYRAGKTARQPRS